MNPRQPLLSCIFLFSLFISPSIKAEISAVGDNVEIARDLDSRTVQRVRVENVNGRERSVTNRVVHLATGLSRKNELGQFVEASPEIELFPPSGAISRKARHSIIFSADAADPNGMLDLQMPPDASGQSKRLRSRVLGVSYYSPENGGQSVWIAELKESVAGEVFFPDTVVYGDAMDGISCDIEIKNMLAGYEQNLIFKAQIPPPSAYGLVNDSAVLELITEVFEPGAVVKKSVVKDGVTDDRQIDLGTMRISVGKSFLAGDRSKSVVVQKQWTQLRDEDGIPRDVLIERIPWNKISGFLATLPPAPQANRTGDGSSPEKSFAAQKTGDEPSPHRSRGIVSGKLILPKRVVANNVVRNDAIQIASAPRKAEGFVLDYSILASQGSLTLSGSTTFFVTNLVSITHLVIEGSAVVKFSTNSEAKIATETVECKTSEYSPASFTSMSDDSCGEQIEGSTGNPWTNYCGDVALSVLGETPVEISNVRFSHLRAGVEPNAGFYSSECVIKHAQFVHCQYPIMPGVGTTALRNVLIYDAETALYGGADPVILENVTVHQCGTLADDYGGYGSNLYITNSLFVTVTNVGNYYSVETNCTEWLTNDTGVFQTVGAFSCYLFTNSSYATAGTTNINAALLSDLRKKSVFAPTVLTNDFTSNTTLSTNVRRDTGTNIAIGYHIDVIDWVIGNRILTNATLTVTNGAVLAFYTTNQAFGSLIPRANSGIISEGSVLFPNRFVSHTTVQPQCNSNWVYPGGIPMIGFDEPCDMQATFRFTEFSRLAGEAGHIDAMGDMGSGGAWTFRHCQFHSASVYLSSAAITGFPSMTVGITNCLFDRTALSLDGGATNISVQACNNLFYGGDISLGINNTNQATFVFKNNFCDANSISVQTGLNFTADYNGFLTNANRLTNNIVTGGAHDVVLTNTFFPYTNGHLGRWYHGINSLIDKGAEIAGDLGLYHFTTQPNQNKETNTVVDIAFHYVAVDGNGNPVDSDSDGFADYVEDIDGDGFPDSNEFSWLSADTNGDGVGDYLNWIWGRRPGVPWQSDSSNNARLIIYTPLK